MMNDDNERAGSVPCFAHMLVDGHPVDPEAARDVARFRRAERTRLLAERRKLSSRERRAMAGELMRRLDEHVAVEAGTRIAVYWPIRGEPDLRDWMASADAAGARVLLPVVAAKEAPLVFRRWRPGCAMAPGVWNIPAPVDGEAEMPDTVIVPLLGIDESGYRLGNGGGYYDRTLVRLRPMPKIVGVGHAFCRMKTIFPMPWDVPMDSVILTDGAVFHR